GIRDLIVTGVQTCALPISLFFGMAGLLLGVGVIIEFMETQLVARLPTAVLATGLMLLAFLSMACGLILDSVARGRREAKRMAYLAVPAVQIPVDQGSVPQAFAPGHYYSPIVDPDELSRRQCTVWTDADALLGIDLNEQLHRSILTEIFPK